MFRELKFGGAGSTRLKMPQTAFDRAATALLFGLAFIIGALFLPIYDLSFSLRGHNGIGQFVKSETLAAKGNRESVGIYEFTDNLGSKVNVTSKYAFKTATQIPKTAKIAWPKGEPQNARVLYQGGFSLIAFLIGVLLVVWGGIALHKVQKYGDSD